MRSSAAAVAVLLLATACGMPSTGGDGEETGSTTTQTSSVPEESISEACSLGDPWSMVETAFVGTVREVDVRFNEEKQAELEELGMDAEVPEWPWVTFSVDRWFTTDFGTEFSMWAPGFDGAPGEDWQIAGALYWAMGAQSGEVFSCVSTPRSEPDLAAWNERFGDSVEAGVDSPEAEADPEVVATIEENRQLWESRRPESYTAILTTYDGRDSSDACGESSSVRLVVEDGVPVEAVDLRRLCHVDDLREVLTIDDTFDLAVAYAGAMEGEIAFDDEYGLITGFYASDRSVEASVGVDLLAPFAAPAHLGTPESLDAAEEARNRWESAGIDSYSMTVDILCFCGGAGRFEATVTDGNVDVRRLDDVEGFDEFDEQSYFTVGGLLDLITSWSGGAPDSVVAGFAEDGYPVDLHIDVETNAIDDELTVLVRHFSPTD